MKALNEFTINEATVTSANLEEIGDDIFNSLRGPRGNSRNTEEAEITPDSYRKEFRDWNATYRWETEEGEDFEEDDDNEVVDRDDKNWKMDMKTLDGFSKKYKELDIQYYWGEKNWVYLTVKLKAGATKPAVVKQVEAPAPKAIDTNLDLDLQDIGFTLFSDGKKAEINGVTLTKAGVKKLQSALNKVKRKMKIK